MKPTRGVVGSEEHIVRQARPSLCYRYSNKFDDEQVSILVRLGPICLTDLSLEGVSVPEFNARSLVLCSYTEYRNITFRTRLEPK